MVSSFDIMFFIYRKFYKPIGDTSKSTININTSSKYRIKKMEAVKWM